MLVEWRCVLLRPGKLREALAGKPGPIDLLTLEFRRRGTVLRSYGDKSGAVWYLVQPVGLADDLRRAGIPDEFDSRTHDDCNRCCTLRVAETVLVTELDPVRSKI